MKYPFLIIVLGNHKLKSGQRICSSPLVHPPVSEILWKVSISSQSLHGCVQDQSLLFANQVFPDPRCNMDRLDSLAVFPFSLSLLPSKDSSSAREQQNWNHSAGYLTSNMACHISLKEEIQFCKGIWF